MEIANSAFKQDQLISAKSFDRKKIGKQSRPPKPVLPEQSSESEAEN